MKINIRVHLSAVTGSDESVIQAIEQYLKDSHPFGLRNEVASVVFIPKQFIAYCIPKNNPQFSTKLDYGNQTDFISGIKHAYIGHKTLITGDELLGIAQLLKHGTEQIERNNVHEQNKRLGFLSGQILSESGKSSGSLEDGDRGIPPSGVN